MSGTSGNKRPVMPSGDLANPGFTFSKNKRIGAYYNKEDKAVVFVDKNEEVFSFNKEAVGINAELIVGNRFVQGISDNDDIDAYMSESYLFSTTVDQDENCELFTFFHDHIGCYQVTFSGGALSADGLYYPLHMSRFINVTDNGLKITKVEKYKNEGSNKWNDTIVASDDEDPDDFGLSFLNAGDSCEYTFNLRIQVQPLTLQPDIECHVEFDDEED